MKIFLGMACTPQIVHNAVKVTLVVGTVFNVPPTSHICEVGGHLLAADGHELPGAILRVEIKMRSKTK